MPEIDGTYTCHWGHPFLRINLMDFIYFVFACMPSDAYHRQFKSPLLCPLGYACEVKQAFVNLLCLLDIRLGPGKGAGYRSMQTAIC